MSDVIHRCEMCGAVLPEGTGANRRYCGACRKLKRKEANHSYNMRRKGENYENLPVVRYCSVCGKQLPADAAPNRRYCIPCGEKIHLEKARERARRLQKAKPKIECGTMMYGVDPGKMYCDACKKARYGKSIVDTGTQPGIVKPKEKPKTNHDLIVDDNAAAAAKGMSYGKFKEWQRRQKELKERGEIY